MMICTKKSEKANKNQEIDVQCAQLEGIIFLLRNLQKDLDYIQDLQNKEIVESKHNKISSDQEKILKISKSIKRQNNLYENFKTKKKQFKRKKIIRKGRQEKYNKPSSAK
ncbi:unnamed protein product [Paramecium sonneborni]|uniref:Uncharacterized protein n=1 Tax=Paramecium sonneborni TaxID=65129 RepID=A0A8S1KDV3_9CILI|nr:unnamed protein product [Paramecium sonneborni]